MPDPIKLKVDLDTAQAMQRAADLEAAFKKLGGKFTPSASVQAANPNYYPQSQASQGPTPTPGVMRQQKRGNLLNPFETIEFPTEQNVENRGRKGRGRTEELDIALGKFSRGLARRLKGVPDPFDQYHTDPATRHFLPDPKAQAAQAKSAMKMGELFTGTNWKQAILGGVTAGFSPWLGARMLTQAFGGKGPFGTGGGGGGGGGGVGGALFGGSASGFSVWYLVIRTIQKLISTLGKVISLIEKGAAIYQGAARSAMTGTSFAQMQAVLGGVGMSGSMGHMTANPLLRGAGSGSGGLMLRAMAGGNMADLRQVMNMRKEIDQLNQSMAFGSKRIGETSMSMQRMNMDFKTAAHTWSAVISDVITQVEPELRLLAAAINGLGKASDWAIRHVRETLVSTIFGPLIGKGTEMLLQKFFPTKKGDNGFLTAPGGEWMKGQSSWEKMGLLINGGPGGKDYARQTAENTKKIADHVARTFPVGDTAAGQSSQPNFNLP